MIGFFRRFLTSWFALALLALVLIAFVLTGVRDPFGGGGPAGTLARVGKIDISEADFSKLWQRAMGKLREDNPKITPEQAARSGAVDQLLDQTISSRALEVFAADQGIAAGDKMLDAEIAAVPNFQVAGRFDQRTYENVLSQQRLTDREVRDGLRGDILRRQLLAPLGAGAVTPVGQALPYARLILEARQGLIGVIPAAALKSVPQPTPADLSAFYTAHKAAFTIPERRSFRYALIDPQVLGAATPPSEAEIAAYYQAHANQYAATEKRRLAQAVVPDQATADRLATAARAGGFDAAAASVAKLTRADIEIGSRTQAEFATATSPEVARAAFALPDGGISEPIKSDFGWHVVHVEAIEHGAATLLEKARPEIIAALVKQRGAAKVTDLIDQLQSASAKNGATFADLVRRFGLAGTQSPPLTATGAAPTGETPDPALKPLIAAAFQSDPGENPSVEDLGQGRAALFQLAEVTPPTLPTLAQIQPAVAAAWDQVARARAVQGIAAAIAAEVKAGTPMAAALAKRGLPAPQPVNVRRIDLLRPGARVPPPILTLFSLPQGGVAPQSAGAQGAWVVQTLAITTGDPATAPQVVMGIRQQFAQLGANELVEQFARASQQAVGVRRNADTIARVRARLSGQADAAQQ